MEQFAAFLAAAAAAMLVPGPDTFVVLRTALTGGARAGAWAAAGSACGNLIWGAASVVGAAGVLAASDVAFTAVRAAGAGYLVALGVQALLAAARGDSLAVDTEGGAGTTPAAAFRRGLASDVLNVKVGLFWTALVPQFVTPGSGPLLPAAMVAAMGALVFAWLAAYAVLAARARELLGRRGAARTVNGAAGTALVVLGARLGVAV